VHVLCSHEHPILSVWLPLPTTRSVCLFLSQPHVFTFLFPCAACAANTLKVTLAPSVPIYQSCLQNFTLSGLTGTDTPDQTLTLHGLNSNVLRAQAAWAKTKGKLVVALQPDDSNPMLAGVSYTFDFTVKNGFTAQVQYLCICVYGYL